LGEYTVLIVRISIAYQDATLRRICRSKKQKSADGARSRLKIEKAGSCAGSGKQYSTAALAAAKKPTVPNAG